MAIAPEQTGIGIRRQFTVAGQDPYDTVEWERRDARISHYATGVVAFEQLGVEVPAGWSLNATNILAQKYFRGTLGTPEREWSLRQVADRVVDTITAWGRKDGYFVDDEEAQTFSDELKYLIIHQKAAFNSPVWFNIGVKGVPQQGSACQPYGALVSTPDGLVPIGRLVETEAVGTKVYDAHGPTAIVAVKANGRKSVLRLHTKAGVRLDVTGDHLVWRRSGQGTGRFVPASQLRPGDQLIWHRTESWGIGEISSTAVAEAALAGWLQSDGFVGQYVGTNRSLTIEAMTVTPQELEWVTAAIDELFPTVHRHERRVVTQDPTLDCRRTRIYGEVLRDFVDRWDLRTRGVAMTVPPSMWEAPLPVVRAYLRSLFQAEGYVSTRERSAHVGLAMISEGIVRGAQQLLARFGIFARVRFTPDRRPDRHPCWALAIQNAADRRRFTDEIGFIDDVKATKLERSLERSLELPGGGENHVKALEIASIEELGEDDVYDIQTESGEYLSGNLRVHNCFILSVDDSMDSILEWYKEEGIIFKGGSGAGVNLSRIRSSKEHLRGGGTASGPVSFMRGADASAGTIKCLDADTPIATTEGVVPIREVHAGTSVLTRSGPRVVAAVHDNGVRPLVRLRTSLGEDIRCTAEHRFWVRTPAAEGWREAGELVPGDAVLMDVSGVDAGSPQALVGVERGHHNELARTLPEVLDEPFALWLGWLWGDGSVTTRRSANFISVQLGDKDPELTARYRSICGSLFGDVNVFESRHTDKPDASVSVRFCSTQVVRFLERNGLRKGPSATPFIPAIVQSSPAPVRAAFLAGLFEADGHVANGCVGFSSVSKTLARDVQRVLLSLAIPSQRSIINHRTGAYGKVPIHTVRIVGGEGQRRFAKFVGFISERKSRLLDEAMTRKGVSPFETQWVLPHAGTEVDKLWQRASPRLRRALAPYCRYGARRCLSLLRARALVDRFPAELEGTRLERFSRGDELWAFVNVEADGEGPTFDLTVEDVHEYLVHNVVTHNSGGKTRRAAKMVILNVDHPDIEDFIWCKAVEERKARALRDAGFDMDLDGKDSHSIQYQNANNSIRVTDEFMNAVIDDADWDLKAVITGDTVRTVRARDLFRQMAKATWECADPGMQFDTTINRWHTAPAHGRINGSNPCFTGDALVHTDKGLIAFKELFARANEGESFGVWTHDATNPDHPEERLELTTPEAFMITGTNEIVRLRFDNGMEVRCTPGHRLFTTNRGYVEAAELTRDDHVKVLDLPAPAVGADYRIPVSTDLADYRQIGDHRRSVNLPEKWSPELGHYLGWLVGDGSVGAAGTISAIYGSPEDRQAVLPRHSELVTWLNGGQTPKPSMQANGTVQQRLSRRGLTAFFAALGLTAGRGPTKRVPASLFQAPTDIVGSFLRGLFDADGCVRRDNREGSHVGLGSSSRDLLVDVQRLLTTLGVTSSIHATKKSAKVGSFTSTRVDGTSFSYGSSAMFDLRISGAAVAAFATRVGFVLPSKSDALADVVSGRVGGCYNTDTSAHLVERVEDGYELTYNLCEPRNHSYLVNGFIVRNCSEYMHVDNSACNLASLNLLTFIEPDGPFDVTGFKAATEVVLTAQEILVGNADYPTEAIAENSRRFRQLGIGYANLGALLMSEGLAYDSDGGRAWAGAITSLMTGHAYATSGRTAARMGPFAGFTENRGATLNVLCMHRDEAAAIDEDLVPPELLSAAQQAWDEAVEIADEYGVRNAQCSVIAPTGTIGLLMDCDTTGLEPDLGLVKMKKLVGGGTMSIVNQTVARALTRLRYDDAAVADILAYIDEHKSILGAPHLDPEHLDVFACSMGDNTIHYQGHVRMMAAIQPFISGALSKTVNLPEEATVEDVEQLHIEAWQLGLKAVAVYRDNCKVAQPLATAKRTAVDPTVSEAEAHDAQLAIKVADLEEALGKQTTVVVKQPVRERMPRRRRSVTFAFRVADCEGFVTVGEYEDGRPGEVFMKVAKQGSTLAGIMDAFAISVSLGLQHGVPLSTYVKKYTSMRFEPAGMTDDPDLRIAQSLVDYIFRRLAVDYMGYTERLELGVLTTRERTQPTLPGVDEAVTPNQSIVDDRLDLDGHTGPSIRDEGGVRPVGPVTGAGPVVPPAGTVMPEAGDAPYCYQCGVQMQRAGSCHACPSCGTTSGCS